jgi:histidyl-tRNA synthetase
VIAIGGDGSCLRSVKQMVFNSNVLYVGVNAGTLGFLQEVKIDDLESFVESLSNCDYKIEEVGIQETEIHINEDVHHYYSLNEIVIREKDLNTAILEIKIDDAKIEITDEELSEKIKEMATNYGKKEEELMQNENLKDYLEKNMKIEKAIKYIINIKSAFNWKWHLQYQFKLWTNTDLNLCLCDCDVCLKNRRV